MLRAGMEKVILVSSRFPKSPSVSEGKRRRYWTLFGRLSKKEIYSSKRNKTGVILILVLTRLDHVTTGFKHV